MAQQSAQTDSLDITVEFTGGLEMLFDNEHKHKVQIPMKDNDGMPTNIAYLVSYICDHVMKDKRKELFVFEGSIRPGILVLINDADWELDGEERYEIVSGDNILFVSTLHGG